jgi:ubiquinone/menaquinone biosynthesis C-methylase UbiE
MNEDVPDEELASRYYIDLAAAFVRGKLRPEPALSVVELIRLGMKSGLRLHKFKRNDGLPRVRKVLGVLRGLGPADLLDIGSGRGTFLWPLLDAFPWLRVASVDRREQRVADVNAVRAGGIDRLATARMDATALALADKSVDVVTLLEVLEHIPEPHKAAAEVVRVARRFVVISVPSKEDDNPEHLHLFDPPALQSLFLNAGAARVSFDQVLNHIVAVVRVS